jgi:uncharacterized membrane protein SirB2
MKNIHKCGLRIRALLKKSNNPLKKEKHSNHLPKTKATFLLCWGRLLYCIIHNYLFNGSKVYQIQ